MGRIEKENTQRENASPPNPNGTGNILEVLSQLDNIAHLLPEFLAKMERLIELLQNSSPIYSSNSLAKGDNIQEKLTELLLITKETRETSGFVKMVFTQEKPKRTKNKVNKSEAVNQYLRLYNKSMKL